MVDGVFSVCGFGGCWVWLRVLLLGLRFAFRYSYGLFGRLIAVCFWVSGFYLGCGLGAFG